MLRPLLETDIEKLRVLRNKYSGFFINQGLVTAEQQREWFQRYLLKKDDIMFSISCPSMTFAGAIALYDISYETLSAEFGRIVVDEGAPKYTGTYAIEALLNFSREKLKLHTIHCSVLKNNDRAITVYKRIGFQHVRSGEELLYFSMV